MAQNLRAKLSHEDQLIIYDVNGKAIESFAQEADGQKSGASVGIASCVKEVAEKSVSVAPQFMPSSPLDPCS